MGTMGSELALHAYIFLGNALHLLMRDGKGIQGNGGAEIPRGELAALYAIVEPLTPTTILPALAELPAGQRELLARCGRECLSRPGREFEETLGVQPEEARQVLAWLDAQGG